MAINIEDFDLYSTTGEKATLYTLEHKPSKSAVFQTVKNGCELRESARLKMIDTLIKCIKNKKSNMS